MARVSLRKAIDMKCKSCIYDPLDKGTWRSQVASCTVSACPLWEARTLKGYGTESEEQPLTLSETDTERTAPSCSGCIHDGEQILFPSGCTGCGADGEFRNFTAKACQEY